MSSPRIRTISTISSISLLVLLSFINIALAADNSAGFFGRFFSFGNKPSESPVGTVPFESSSKAAPKVSTSEFTSAISERITNVDEFRFIREAAQKLGVRAYLFGGTASGFGHYVKWDLARELGDTRYQKERFDYEFTNMYRSNQDLDIVIDGNPEQAQKQNWQELWPKG